MKTAPFRAVAASALAIFALASQQALAQSVNPSMPFGKLTVSPTQVLTGTRPSLTWSISYPSSAKDFVTITTPGGITPKQDLRCDVRILGASVTTQDAKGHIIFVETVGLLCYNGMSTWERIFDGTYTSAIAQNQGIVKTFTATANQPINFGGYTMINSVNSLTYTSLIGKNVRFHVNGDKPPSAIADYNASGLQSFIKPYLDASGNVKIGPLDVIVFIELTTSKKSTLGYDLQDLVFLITLHTP